MIENGWKLLVMLILMNGCSRQPQVAVAATQMNALYLGLENPIEVAAQGVRTKDLVVVPSDSTVAMVKSGADGRFVVLVKKRAKEGLILNVYKKEVAPRKLLAQAYFRILKVPKPRVSLNGKEGGFISRAELKTIETLYAWMPCFVFDGADCMVKSYDYIYLHADSTILPARGTVHGESLPNQLKEKFARAQVNDQLILSNISVRTQFSHTTSDVFIDPLVFEIK